MDRDAETLTLSAPDGRVELQLRLTPEGVTLVSAGSLRVEVPEELRLSARSLALQSTEDLRIDAEGEVFVTGKRIHLN